MHMNQTPFNIRKLNTRVTKDMTALVLRVILQYRLQFNHGNGLCLFLRSFNGINKYFVRIHRCFFASGHGANNKQNCKTRFNTKPLQA